MRRLVTERKSVARRCRGWDASGVDDAAYRISRVAGSAGLAATTKRLLDLLPSWFGIPEANAGYVGSATRLPGLVAHSGTEPIGVLLYRRHFPEAAEIHLMAVAPSWHRRGVGRALPATVVADLSSDGCRVLQVKTLGATHPDQGYARTRAFYQAVGFLPLEETNDLWAGHPCLIMVRWLPGSP
jgi:GNAT superfamily N-acetyltransferase